MRRSSLFRVASAALLTSLASAQGPDIIHYTFDNGDAENTASGSVPDGIVAAGVGFGPGICGGGAVALVSGATCQIDTGWTTDLGTGDWTVGMWLDRTNSPVSLSTLRYIMGNSSAGSMRCFVGGIAGTDGITLRAPSNAVTIPGGGALRPVHVAWCYDSAAGVVNGYLDLVSGLDRRRRDVELHRRVRDRLRELIACAEPWNDAGPRLPGGDSGPRDHLVDVAGPSCR